MEHADCAVDDHDHQQQRSHDQPAQLAYRWSGVGRNIPPLDLLLAFTVPFNYALANTLIRRHLSHLPPLTLTLCSLSMTGAVLLPVSLVLPGHHGVDSDTLLTAFACLAVLGVIGTGLAQFIFNSLLQVHGPLFAGMVTYLIPIGAVVFGWVDHEHVSGLQLAALGGIFAMVALVQYGAARRE